MWKAEPIFESFHHANAPKKPFFWLQTAYYICVPFHFEQIFDKFCRANALEKSFAWLQTAFAWKVKLVSTSFDWVQNSLFFPSSICQKKQQTRILDHSLKSVILRPQFKGRNFGKTCLTTLEVKVCKNCFVTCVKNFHLFENKCKKLVPRERRNVSVSNADKNAVWSQAKVFWARWRAKIFWRQRAPPQKTFFLFQTALAWKVKLLSHVFAWIQNSFFGSLICRKKQFTRILDDSWKSIVLVPHKSLAWGGYFEPAVR